MYGNVWCFISHYRITPRILQPKGSDTYRNVDVDEENLKMIVLDKTECVNQPKKTNVPQISLGFRELCLIFSR